MKRKWQREQLKPFLESLVFLALGFLIIWIAKTAFNIQEAAILITLMLIPSLLFLILSGRLQEFSAGGVTAKFTIVAQNPVFKKSEENVQLLEVENFEKAGPDQLMRYLAHLDFSKGNKYMVLGVSLGEGHNYKREALLYYLDAFTKFHNFKYLIVMQGQRVFAYLQADRARDILVSERNRRDQGEDSFVGLLNTGNGDKLLKNYDLITNAVLTTDTNMEALEKMTKIKVDSAVVTDENLQLKGIVERQQLLSQLILSIAQ